MNQNTKKHHTIKKGTEMKLSKFTLFVFIFALLFSFGVKAEDLNTKKMEKATKEILDIMVKGDDASAKLRKFISEDWLETKRLNVKKYNINNYSPDSYTIIYTGGDICIATIGGSSWQHLLVFKFTEESGQYKVVPKGISEASADYIDPWNFVKDYICSTENYEPEPNQEK